ncbi:aminoacyl-tRNA hydrolase [bacterium]|nr:aminoacyl-tRNA hydrolase [bacterium]
MSCIIGLGNPGKRYVDTRHNVGFMVLDEIARRYSKKFSAGSGDYFIVEASRRFPVVLIKPTTFMNLSGIAARHIMKKKELVADEILVVHDDLDLQFGRLRLRTAGSSGGHNGLGDIIMRLGVDTIPRLRIGIGDKPERVEGADYVLSNFNSNEKKELPFVIATAADALELAVSEDFEAAMNEFNKKKEI